MKEYPSVSVVIPVYNTEAYVEETVRSILNQTFRDMEVIIVNDGSTDNSLSILERLSKEDSRIKLINRENGGLSAARNTGTENAKAPYIVYIDSDDKLSEDAIERCYSRCSSQKLDLVTYDAEPFADDPKEIMSMRYDRSGCLREDTVYSGADALLKQLDDMCFTPQVCLCFISRETLDKHNLNFYNGIIHEDELFTPQLYLNSERVGYIPEKFFKRRFRKGSIMKQTFKWKNIEGYLTATAGLEALKADVDDYKNMIIDRYLCKLLNAVMWRAHVLPLSERLKLLRICIAKGYTKYITMRSIMIMMLKKYRK